MVHCKEVDITEAENKHVKPPNLIHLNVAVVVPWPNHCIADPHKSDDPSHDLAFQ